MQIVWDRIILPNTSSLTLDNYAAMHAQTHGEAVDATTLIPHMLEALMAGDRGFRRGRGDDTRPAPRAAIPKG